MRIVGRYSFNDGAAVVARKYPKLLAEVEAAIGAIDSSKLKTKASKEVTMAGQMLYSPVALNDEFKAEFAKAGHWVPIREKCDYRVAPFCGGFTPSSMAKGAFREMDFVKQKLGVEVQFGKYAFMVYNVCAKMTIFKNLGHIDTGIEIVPVRDFALEMSSGVSYYEQFVWDLDARGKADIDIPVLILGITE